MNRNWKRGLSVALVAVCSLVIVADTNAFHRKNRRGGGGGGGGCGGGYSGGGYGGGGYGYGGGGYGGGGYGGYGYGGGYARYNSAPAYYGGGYAPAYGGSQAYGGTYGSAGFNAQPGLAPSANLNAGPVGIDGTGNADLGGTDRSARINPSGISPSQDLPDNTGAPNAEFRAPNVGPNGNEDAASTGGASSSLRTAPPVAPGTR